MIALALLLTSMSSAFVMDGSGHYSDCVNFDTLISMTSGVSSSQYMTIIGTDSGYGTYNVFLPNDYWTGSNSDYITLMICFAAAGTTSSQASWSSDNVNVVMANKMFTLSTYNARSMLSMDKTDAQWITWLNNNVTYMDCGCDDIAAAAGYY